MAKHTPGPWSADPPDRHEPYWIVHAAAGVGGVIAEVCSCPRPEAERDPSEVEANARLMAAAPKLREVLDDAPLPSVQGNYSEFLSRYYSWLDRRNAVLADAEGGGAYCSQCEADTADDCPLDCDECRGVMEGDDGMA